MSGNSTNNLLLENIAINVVLGIVSLIVLILIITILIIRIKKCLKKQVVEEITHKEKPTDNYRTPNPLYNNEHLNIPEPYYDTIETSL